MAPRKKTVRKGLRKPKPERTPDVIFAENVEAVNSSIDDIKDRTQDLHEISEGLTYSLKEDSRLRLLSERVDLLRDIMHAAEHGMDSGKEALRIGREVANTQELETLTLEMAKMSARMKELKRLLALPKK